MNYVEKDGMRGRIRGWWWLFHFALCPADLFYLEGKFSIILSVIVEKLNISGEIEEVEMLGEFEIGGMILVSFFMR